MTFLPEHACLLPGTIDPLVVRQCFARPSRLRESAFLRREIAARMHERLAMIRAEPSLVLDAGCGEGDDLAALHQRFPRAKLLGLDISHPMLLAAKGAEPVCADFAALPFPADSFGMLWSNLALHWHPEPRRALAEWRRVLGNDGLLLFTCFGPETLAIVREAFRQADGYAHILPFMEMHDLGDALVDAGFPSPVLDREILTVTYTRVEKLLADIRAFGGNALIGRPRGLMGKAAYRRLTDFLEAQKDAGGNISLPFEIIYAHAFCTVRQPEKPRESPLFFHPGFRSAP
ncbi:MAG: methyltransferase domain-containing protein [Burkholderiaceae bacterium]|jgi:malonyl-CoA O-methyltransferase|nr:methyltransferase domain-containing protein [Burkholderiaceae bacterium]